MFVSIQNENFEKNLYVWLPYALLILIYNCCIKIDLGVFMEIKEILSRIGYVRNKANLSAREVSLRMGMSPQYVAQLESGRIVLTIAKLLQILEICDFPIERFFSNNIADYNVDNELKSLIESLPLDKKKNIIEFIKK